MTEAQTQVSPASKKAVALKLHSWLKDHHFKLFSTSVAAQLCDQALEQIITHEGKGVIHPSVILALATANTFQEDANTLALTCVNEGLVELTQHGGKGSDVRRTVANMANQKNNVMRVQEWLNEQKSRAPHYLHQMPTIMCQKALNEIQQNGNHGLIHPSIIFTMDGQKLFTENNRDLIALCMQAGLVQVTRIEQRAQSRDAAH